MECIINPKVRRDAGQFKDGSKASAWMNLSQLLCTNQPLIYYYQGGLGSKACILKNILQTLQICYTEFPDLIRTQRMALDSKIRSICRAHIVRPGLPYFKQHGMILEQRQAPPRDDAEKEVGTPNPSDLPPLPLDIPSIPGVLEACWTPDQAQQSRCGLSTHFPLHSKIVTL